MRHPRDAKPNTPNSTKTSFLNPKGLSLFTSVWSAKRTRTTCKKGTRRELKKDNTMLRVQMDKNGASYRLPIKVVRVAFI